jgi:hypothetical protein
MPSVCMLVCPDGVYGDIQGADDKLGQTLWTHSKQ